MSFDLHFFHVPPGADPAQLHLAMEEDGGSSENTPPSPRLVHILSQTVPQMPKTERPKYVEFDDESLGLQIVVSGESVAVSVPYWHGAAAARRIFRTIWECAQALKIQGGLDAFDPQSGRLLDLDRDLGSVVASYVNTAIAAGAVRPRPWWKFW
jgi:hypothetical protein